MYKVSYPDELTRLTLVEDGWLRSFGRYNCWGYL